MIKTDSRNAYVRPVLSAGLLLVMVLHAHSVYAAMDGGSCLVRRTDVQAISDTNVEDADERFSALRPCDGRVRKGKVEVIFSTGDGVTERAEVTEGQSVRSRLEKISGKSLVDIWPKRSLLASAVDLLKGRRITTSGLSGFDEKSGALPINGEVVALPGLILRLKFHGWDESASVQVSQKGWSEVLQPSHGVVTFPVDRIRPGELRISQGKRSAVLTASLPSANQELQKLIREIDVSTANANERAMRKALLFQENQYLINALAEFSAAQ